MRAEDFFGEFNGLFQAGQAGYIAAEAYYESTGDGRFKLFTNAIIEAIQTLLIKHNLCVNKEYYRIDIIGWTQRKEELSQLEDFESCMWDLQVAVEHENNEEKWMDEVVKLAHICCPLRVVIGYLPAKHTDGERQVYLDYVAGALEKLACKNNVVTGEFLIIIGNSHTDTDTDTDDEKFFKYKPYLYDSTVGKFIFKENWIKE